MTKQQLKDFLTEKGLDWGDWLTRVQLLEIAMENNPPPTYLVDTLFKAAGHEILRLPPYHPELNPIEQVWSVVKRYVARHTDFKIQTILRLVEEALSTITNDVWQNYIRHWKEVVDQFWLRDDKIADIVDFDDDAV